MPILVLLVIIIATVAIFLIQNATPVAVSFLFWRFEASLAIVVVLSVVTGIVITAVIAFSGWIRQHIKKVKLSHL